MKKIFKIRDFSDGGLNTDMPPYDMPNSVITDGLNFRCINNAIQSFGGQRRVGVVPDGYTRHIVNAISGTQSYWLIAGQFVHSYNDGFEGDVTPEDFPTGSDFADKWSSAKMGSIILMNNGDIGPYYWPRPVRTQKLLPLPWDVSTGETWQDKGEFCQIIRAHRNRLIALGATLDGTYVPMSVRWSDPADNNDIPYTWEVAPDTTANFVNLHDEGGRIVDGRSLRNNFVIYREGAIWTMNYTGGPFVYSLAKQTFNIGALSRNCVVEVNNSHLVFGDGDIVLFDGSSVRSLVNNRIRRRINNSIDTNNFQNSFVFLNKGRKEVWCCFPTNGSVFCNIAYVWNFENDTWGVREIPNLSHADSGMINFSDTDDDGTWLDLEKNDINWGEDDTLWNAQEYVPFESAPFGIAPDGEGLYLDPEHNTPDEPVNTFFERTNIALGGQQQVTSISEVYPNCEGKGKLEIMMGSHDYAGSPIRWKPPVFFDIGNQRKVDIRTTGELHAIRVRYIGKEKFKFSGMDIAYTEAGER